MKDDATDGVSKGAVLIVATMTGFTTPLAASSVNIALPSIGSQLSLDAITLNWVATAYLLTGAMFLVPFGRGADIYGRKRIFAIGILINTVASILCAISSSGTWLVAFRALQGFGGAMMAGTAIAILTSVFPENERGRALGIQVAGTYFGLSVGPLLGGLLTEHLGWRSVFLLSAFLNIVIAVVLLWKLRGEWAYAKGEKFDYIGSTIYAISMVAIMYAFPLLPSVWGIGLILIGVLGIAVFVKLEIRLQYPVLNMVFFRSNTVFALSNLAALINYSATYAVTFMLSFYLQYIKGFTPEHAGLILVAQPIIQAVISPLAGRLSDRIEPRIVASLGMVITTIGLVMLISLNSATSLSFVLTCLFILGIGFGFFSSPNTNAIMGSVDRRSYGVAAGMLGTSRSIGQTFSMGLSLMLFGLYMGRVEITPEYYSLLLKSIRMAFIVSAAICFAGIFASAARGKTRR